MHMDFTFPDSIINFPLKFWGFSSRLAETRFGQIHYLEKRVPQAKGFLVFLHGIGASGGQFGQVLNLLQRAGYSIIALDLPSHGLSPDLKGSLNAASLYE